MTTPFEPSADMRAMAKTTRNMYMALVQEGFTKNEAMQILGSMLTAAFIANRGNDK